jgi:hypothetical protein
MHLYQTQKRRISARSGAIVSDLQPQSGVVREIIDDLGLLKESRAENSPEFPQKKR